MTTVDELARDTIASIATDANAIAAAKWIDNRYQEMVSRVRFRHLREIGELSLPSVEDTGVVTITRGSTDAVGVGTTWVTDIGTGTQEYYYFRANTAWYKIASIGGETALTLASTFAETDVSAGSYRIVKRHHALDSSARWMGSFVLTRLRLQLKTGISLEALDIMAPGRPLAGHIPYYAVQVGVDSNGYVMVEIYPPPVTSEIIHYVYWRLPTTLAIGSTIPQVIDPYTLKEGVLIDLYRYEKSIALRKGNIEQASVWRNEEKAQMTIWERKIKEAIRTSRGADDISIILDMFPYSPRMMEQRTARDYIYDNWSR